MDLILTRLAGSARPDRSATLAGLKQVPWLTLDTERFESRTLVYPGGTLRMVDRQQAWPRFVAPSFLADISSSASFEWLAPRLVTLAGGSTDGCC